MQTFKCLLFTNYVCWEYKNRKGQVTWWCFQEDDAMHCEYGGCTRFFLEVSERLVQNGSSYWRPGGLCKFAIHRSRGKLFQHKEECCLWRRHRHEKVCVFRQTQSQLSSSGLMPSWFTWLCLAGLCGPIVCSNSSLDVAVRVCRCGYPA